MKMKERMILSSSSTSGGIDKMIFDQENKKRAKEARGTREAEGEDAEEIAELKETEMIESHQSFLTNRQLEVLQMRHQGLSQQDVADRLGTTRSNISILEKRAHKNIARSERTVQQWLMICAPISLFAKGGTDVFDLPRMIFAAADEKGIRLPVTSMDILIRLERKAPRLFHKRALEKDARIYVTGVGELMVEEVN